MRLVLASASPQRSAILAQLGIGFEVCPANVEEETVGDPVAVAEGNARRKALAIDAAPGARVLGADTVVALDGDLLGKPCDAVQARAFLGRLAGHTHRVVSGIAIASGGVVERSAADVTEVRFRSVTAAFLDAYVATGEWEGRAGGYAIQGRGAALVASISGDYLGVVGLPSALLLDLVPELLEPAA